MALVRRLLTIPISHYCEKARWALDRAGLDYEEERHLQGMNRIVSRRAGGRGTLPVLVADEGVFAESEEIVRYADAALDPDLRLIPSEADLREQVLELSRRLDGGLGPDGRRLMYARMLPLKRDLLDFNNQGVPPWEARVLAAAWPLATRCIERGLGIGPATLAEDDRRVRAAFDEMAELLADGRRHLCGDRFTAADLTFACLAAPVTVPPEYTVRLPQPDELPDEIASDIRAYREHPAGAYALALFREHRERRPAAVPG
ncbi:MAG TPA: glutathione S-transferase family protein [Thermoleophilaceae bacterium]|nr:glutathione S-transferase family protein [Thermoleophilaceae bacterium]